MYPVYKQTDKSLLLMLSSVLGIVSQLYHKKIIICEIKINCEIKWKLITYFKRCWIHNFSVKPTTCAERQDCKQPWEKLHRQVLRLNSSVTVIDSAFMNMITLG